MSPAAEKMELDKIGGCVFVVVAVVVPRAAPATQTYHTHRPPASRRHSLSVSSGDNLI